MPLLKKELDVFPPTLFELGPEGLPWWVAHVRSRQEKALARYLRPIGVPFYLPQREHRVRRASRSFASFLPLFPGYLFFRGSAADRVAALRSNLIVRILDVFDQDLLGAELSQLNALQSSGALLTPCAPLEPGDAVRIVDGPFQGYTGVVVRGADRPRLVVAISVLRKAVEVELERGSVSLRQPGLSPRRVVSSAVA